MSNPEFLNTTLTSSAKQFSGRVRSGGRCSQQPFELAGNREI